MQKKLVICDIDNTLVVKHQTLTQRASEMIEKMRKKGVYFGIASGRSMPEVRRMVDRWGFEDLDVLIGLNGSALWDGVDRTHQEYFILKKELLEDIVKTMSQFKTTNILMYKNDVLLCTVQDELVLLSAKHSHMKFHQVEDVTEFYEDDNAKIMFRVSEEEMPIIEAYFETHTPREYRAFKTQSTLLEFSDVRVSKAYTLQRFCERHNIAMEEVIAFGDTTNDNDLLEVSGWGVCLANGSDDTKAIADEITDLPCDEDGWADYMEQHFFQEHLV